MPDISQSSVNQLIKVEIADRKMKAFLTLKEPEAEKPQTVSENDLHSALDKAGVKYGLNNDVIKEIIAGKKWGERIMVAVGTEPTSGEDAKLEFFFPTEISLKPHIEKDGRVDYKEINIVNSVEKDALLIRKTPPTLGTKGVDVTGNAVSAVNGKDAILSLGQGVYKDEEDNLLIKASIDGVVFYNSKKGNLEVQQLYVIPGSVNYSTGNVHVKSSVEIRGDVEPGFSIVTPYNIEVKGVVEVAKISCEGTLKIKDGILGDGVQIMKVGGDLHSGYINNQVIKCGGSVYAATEIRNSVIECEDEVMIMKPNGIIIGGRITAATKVTSPTIGNIYSIPTEIEVGIIPKFKEKFDAKEKERVALQKRFEEIQHKISMIALTSSLGADDHRIAAYKNQWNECEANLETVTKEAKELEEAYQNVDDPGVYVTKTVFPGVVVKIKYKSYEVKEEMSRVMFKLIEDEIACLPFR
jgi:uncharacterized protein